jgi:acyl-CoA thioesterase I
LLNNLTLRENQMILFQGDSITDSGRKRNHNESLGDGYVMMTAAWLSAWYSEYNLKFINRGVSGNLVRDLKKRWKKDCLDLKPNIVSILVGINDIHWLANSDESFRSDYRSVLEQTRQLGCQIVLLEPFLVDSKEILELTEELNSKIAIVRELSKEFETGLIPLNEIFMEACVKSRPSFWALDGVHPTLAGHALIAQSWLKNLSGKR